MAQVGSTQLQYYRHDYAKVCMTGLLGCRWHRYKQSTKGSRKRDVAWFVFCLIVSLFVIFWFYYWLIAANDKLSVNEQMYTFTRRRVDWFLFALVIFSILFAYVVLLMFLSLCHIIQGHQIYTHPVHLILMMFILAACVVTTVAMEELWHEEWSVILFSLQVFGPFLQIGAVGFMTILSWVIAKKWFRITKLEAKLGSLCIYCVLMLALYLSPLFINSPCVILEQKLPPRPKMLAHRGASSLAPENTVIAFEIAAQYGAFGIETDVRISLDGELFLMHDRTLHRTTNVAEVFPDLVSQYSSNFNTSQLDQLSAGEWFVKSDPTGSVRGLSEEQKSIYRNQKIPSFIKTLELCIKLNLTVMFDIFLPQTSHPYYNSTYPTLVDIVSMSGINKSKVFWPTPSYSEFKPPSDWKTLYMEKGAGVEFLKQNNYSGIHGAHHLMDTQSLRLYRKNNLTTSVYLVNKAWLYSFYWCIGVDMITTDYCEVISKVDSPVWHLSPKSYLILWVVVDCLSAVAIVIMFLVQRYRLYDHRYHPERLSLNSHSNGSSTWGPKRTRRSMKEKLLMRDVQADNFDFEPDDDLGIDSNGYNATVTAIEGRELSQAFHSNRNSYNSKTAKDNDENDVPQDFNSNRASFVSTSHSFHGNDANRSSFISSVENGELFGDSVKRNSYKAVSNYEGDYTDIFPNGSTDITQNSNANTYQSETAFT